MLEQRGYKPNLMVGDQSYPAFELRNILFFIEQQFGAELVKDICQQIGVGMAELSACQFVYVWQVEYAMEILRNHGDEEIGAKLGASYRLDSLDILLPYFTQFNSLLECFKFVVKHPELVGSFTDSIIRVEQDKVWVRWLNTGKSQVEKYAFQFEHSVCSLLSLARELTGQEIVLDTICIAKLSQNRPHDFLTQLLDFP